MEQLEKKFHIWSEKLLDLTKKNNLLNYREKKVGSIQFDEEIDGMFNEIFERNFIISKRPTFEVDEMSDEEIEASLQEHNSKLKSLKLIRQNANSHYNEFGFHSCYLIFGFLNWREVESTDSFHSPLLMVPVEIGKGEGETAFEISMRNDEVIKLNPVIIKKLWDDFNINLEDFAEIEINQDSNHKISMQQILNNIESHLDSTEWIVDYRIMLDNFNFQNFAIYKDLENNKEKFFENPLISLLAGVTTEKNLEFISDYNKIVDLAKNPLKENLQILDADSSQQVAIIKARRGDSFVLQGPPGTGKSQTITNIIAEALGAGKKVLFVSEKQAALQVVYDKLKKAGLSDFILSLHDVKQSKELIKNQIQDVATGKKNEFPVDMYLYDKLETESSILDDYATSINTVMTNGYSRFELFGKLSKVMDVQSYHFDFPEKLVHYDKIKLEELLDRVKELTDSYTTNSQEYLNNSWRFLQNELSFEEKDKLTYLSKQISYLYNEKINYQEKLVEKIKISNFGEFSLELIHQLMELQERQISINWSWVTLDANQLILELQELKDIEETIQKYSIDLKHSEQMLSNQLELLSHKFENSFFEVEDVESVLKKMKFKYHVFFRRMSREYRELITRFKEHTKDYQLDYQTLVSGLEQLSDLKTEEVKLNNKKNELRLTEKNYSSKKAEFKKRVDLSNSEKIQFVELQLSFKWLKDIQKLKEQHPYLSDSFLCKIFKEQEIQLMDVKLILESLKENDDRLEEIFRNLIGLFPNTNYDRDAFLEYIQQLDFNEYQKFIDYRRLRDSLINTYELSSFVEFLDHFIIDKEEILPIFKKRFYSYLLEHNNSMESGIFSKQNHINVVNRFKELDKQTMELARKRVYNYLVRNLPDLENTEYFNEVRILKKEFNKKARFLPTRKLIEKLPNLLPKYKPCIMMSPLTVSTYFGTNIEWEFDLVIFDEASQVRPEYAIGSIARGKQIIVAGDSKQMPPTSFFSATNIDDEQIDDSQEDLVELESVLDELAVVLPETYLDWHYRSKDESLITFSNIKFYNNRLLTFPSENIDKKDSIQFTHVPDGVWESRNGNKPEADKVLESIIWYADHFPNKSLGVVAFGKSQSTQIEERLEKFLEQNPKYNSYFDENKSEPFFIKNLENVQGDERDIIIISVGYGRRPDGKLIMNFGPLTKSGGERRLNVAASRAREKMHIVSSIKGSDIRVDDTSNENRHILRDFLDYAELGREVLVGYDTNIVDRELHFDSDFEENVYDFLVREGYTVHTQVGDSGYKIDLAIVHPNSSGRYLLAIECDGRAYHSSKTARDRDRLRQEILEGKGWKFYRIWSSNWLYDNNNEKKSIREAIKKAILESESSDTKSTDVTFEEEREKSDLEFEPVESKQLKSSKYDVVLDDLNSNEEEKKVSESFIEENSERNNLDLEILKENHVVQDLEFFSSHEHDLEGICSVLLQHAKRFRGQLVGDWIRYVNEKHFGRKRLTSYNENIYKKCLLHLENTGRITIREGYLSAIEVYDYYPTSSDLHQLAVLSTTILSEETTFEKIAKYYKLPNYQEIDVYHFKTPSKITVLSDLLMKIASLHIDKPVKEWFRAINNIVFGKKRLSEGYEKVYRKALNKLINEGLIVVEEDILRLIKDREAEDVEDYCKNQRTSVSENHASTFDEHTSKIMFSKVNSIVHLLKKQKVTGYRISRDTKGKAREMSLIALKDGRAEIENISFQTAQAMIEWYDLYYKDYQSDE
ncbi:DUF4011 domain-containing protein [Streptococcus suis]|nr:DUF4011 domain-containing protein [Streptococcus suis]